MKKQAFLLAARMYSGSACGLPAVLDGKFVSKFSAR